jgi:tetratricopeptide (TPR) repeat protein
MIGTASSYKGEYERALKAFQRAAQLSPVGREDTEELADAGLVFFRMGRRADGEKVITDLQERARQGYRRVAPSLAGLYALQGNKDEAFRWLARALEVRDPVIGYLEVDPRWDSLRSDRRFNDLLSQLGFDRDR